MARGSKVQEFSPMGLNLDAMPVALQADVYTSSSNMRTTGSGMTRADGEIQYNPQVPFAPKWGILFQEGYTPMLLACGDAGVATCDGTEWIDVTPAGWGAFTGGMMTGGLLNGYPVSQRGHLEARWFNGLMCSSCRLVCRQAGLRAGALQPASVCGFL
jgi:hypothetical protein